MSALRTVLGGSVVIIAIGVRGIDAAQVSGDGGSGSGTSSGAEGSGSSSGARPATTRRSRAATTAGSPASARTAASCRFRRRRRRRGDDAARRRRRTRRWRHDPGPGTDGGADQIACGTAPCDSTTQVCCVATRGNMPVVHHRRRCAWATRSPAPAPTAARPERSAARRTLQTRSLAVCAMTCPRTARQLCTTNADCTGTDICEAGAGGLAVCAARSAHAADARRRHPDADPGRRLPGLRRTAAPVTRGPLGPDEVSARAESIPSRPDAVIPAPGRDPRAPSLFGRMGDRRTPARPNTLERGSRELPDARTPSGGWGP